MAGIVAGTCPADGCASDSDQSDEEASDHLQYYLLIQNTGCQTYDVTGGVWKSANCQVLQKKDLEHFSCWVTF